MTAPALTEVTAPSLREIVLDALSDAFYARRAEIEGCRDCTRNPAGVCAEHQADNDLANEYEDARKQIEHGASLAGLADALVGGTGETA